MSQNFHVGDRVRLIGVPEWLVHDLPNDERLEIAGCVGKVAVIEKIDEAGYYWLGFGSVMENSDAAYFTGHSFCVPGECLAPATQ